MKTQEPVFVPFRSEARAAAWGPLAMSAFALGALTAATLLSTRAMFPSEAQQAPVFPLRDALAPMPGPARPARPDPRALVQKPEGYGTSAPSSPGASEPAAGQASKPAAPAAAERRDAGGQKPATTAAERAARGGLRSRTQASGGGAATFSSGASPSQGAAAAQGAASAQGAQKPAPSATPAERLTAFIKGVPAWLSGTRGTESKGTNSGVFPRKTVFETQAETTASSVAAEVPSDARGSSHLTPPLRDSEGTGQMRPGQPERPEDSRSESSQRQSRPQPPSAPSSGGSGQSAPSAPSRPGGSSSTQTPESDGPTSDLRSDAQALARAVGTFENGSLRPAIAALEAAAATASERLADAVELVSSAVAAAQSDSKQRGLALALNGIEGKLSAQVTSLETAKACLSKEDYGALSQCAGTLDEALVSGPRARAYELGTVSGSGRGAGASGYSSAAAAGGSSAQALVRSAQGQVVSALEAWKDDGSYTLAPADDARTALQALERRLSSTGYLKRAADGGTVSKALSAAQADLAEASSAWSQAQAGGEPGEATLSAIKAVRAGVKAQLDLQPVLESLDGALGGSRKKPSRS